MQLLPEHAQHLQQVQTLLPTSAYYRLQRHRFGPCCASMKALVPDLAIVPRCRIISSSF